MKAAPKPSFDSLVHRLGIPKRAIETVAGERVDILHTFRIENL